MKKDKQNESKTDQELKIWTTPSTPLEQQAKDDKKLRQTINKKRTVKSNESNRNRSDYYDR
jgi:competence CoiA-like predicted nuclease